MGEIVAMTGTMFLCTVVIGVVVSIIINTYSILHTPFGQDHVWLVQLPVLYPLSSSLKCRVCVCVWL